MKRRLQLEVTNLSTIEMQDNLLDAILVTYIEPDDILETFMAMKKAKTREKK